MILDSKYRIPIIFFKIFTQVWNNLALLNYDLIISFLLDSYQTNLLWSLARANVNCKAGKYGANFPY